jgi:hypothetical protein
MTRAELYNLIWGEPLGDVTKRIGVSSAELRRICREYEIPLPPKGYWAKRSWNHAPARPPLPNIAPSLLTRINTALKRLGRVPLRIADSQLDAFDLKIVVPGDRAAADKRPTTHVLVETLGKKLRSLEPTADGFIICGSPELPHVRIGQDNIERTLALFSALLNGLDEAGYEAVKSAEGFRIVADGELFAVRLTETRERLNLPLRHESEARRPTKSHRPSGRLSIEVVDTRPLRWSDTNRVGIWYDAPTHPPDRCIRLVLRAVASTTVVIRHIRAQSEVQAQIREAAVAEDAIRELARREEAFLFEKAESFARLQCMTNLAELFAEEAAAEADEPVNVMARTLQNLVRDLRGKFERDVVAVELNELGLFQRMKSD